MIEAYIMLQPLHDDANSIQQAHLCLRQLDFLHQGHQSIQDHWRIRQKPVCVELPLIRNIFKLPASGDSNYLVIQGIILVQQMLVDLVYNRLLVFRDPNRNPLGNNNGDTPTDDVEPGLLFLRLRDQRILNEGVKVELIVQYVGSETDGGVNRVFE
jgi:hypothetical protein